MHSKDTSIKLYTMQTDKVKIKSRRHKKGLVLCEVRVGRESLHVPLRGLVSYLLEAGLPVLRLGVVRREGCGRRLLQRLRQAGARGAEPRARRRRRAQRRGRGQAGPRAPRRALALRTFRTQHASVPRRAPAHTVKISTPSPARARPAAAATVQRVHIQV